MIQVMTAAGAVVAASPNIAGGRPSCDWRQVSPLR